MLLWGLEAVRKKFVFLHYRAIKCRLHFAELFIEGNPKVSIKADANNGESFCGNIKRGVIYMGVQNISAAGQRVPYLNNINQAARVQQTVQNESGQTEKAAQAATPYRLMPDSYTGISAAEAYAILASREGGAGDVSQTMNLEESHKWEDGAPTFATWSGNVDASMVSGGATITLNGSNGNSVTFEFVTEAYPDDWTKINIGGIATDDPKAADKIAKAFTKTLNNKENIEKLARSLGWTRNFAPDIVLKDEPVKAPEAKKDFCTWASDGTNWTLTLAQPEEWAHDGDSISVTGGASFNSTHAPNGRMYTLNNLDTSKIRTNDKLELGKQTYTIQAVDEGDSKAGTVEGNNIYIDLDSKTSWGNALQAALDVQYGSGAGYSVRANAKETEPSLVLYMVIQKPAGNVDDFDFNIKNSPEVSADDDAIKSSTIDTPAYLKYTLDTEKLKDGDSFLFKGTRFVFDNDGKQDFEGASGSKERVMYVSFAGPGNSSETLHNFADTFNRGFAKKGGVGKSVGAPRNVSGLQNGFGNLLALLNAGAFEMKVDDAEGLVYIYAKTKDVLKNDGTIQTDEDDGQFEAAVENPEEVTEGEPAEGATEGEPAEGAPVEGTESGSARDAAPVMYAAYSARSTNAVQSAEEKPQEVETAEEAKPVATERAKPAAAEESKAAEEKQMEEAKAEDAKKTDDAEKEKSEEEDEALEAAKTVTVNAVVGGS